jgi:uncharacterized LabA/DUF88 family protein
MTRSSDRIAIFIDGANLHSSAKTLGFDIDYKRLLEEFQGRGSLVRAFYYIALHESQEYSSIRPLIDWLDYNGYTVVTKPAKEFVDASGRRKVKSSMDVELAVDAMELAAHLDQVVLFSGDGDFRPLVEVLQRRGVRVTVVSTVSAIRRCSPTNCAAKPTCSPISSSFDPGLGAIGRPVRLLGHRVDDGPVYFGKC